MSAKVNNNIFSSLLKDADDRKNLSKVIIPSFFIHFVAGVLYILTVLILTRKLGAEQYGIITYSFTIITIFTNLSTTGFNMMAAREPPALLSKGKTELWKGFFLWSSKFVLYICIAVPLLIASFIIVATNYFHLFTSSPYTLPILFALGAVPFYCLMNYYSAWIRGQHKTVLSFLPDNIIKPAFFLILLLFFFRFTVWNVILVRILSFAAGLIFVIVAFFRTTKMEGITPQYDTSVWKASLKSFFFLTALVSINSKLDIVMLGLYKDASQVGIYDGADKVAAFIILFQTLMNQISTASISRLYAMGEKEKLQTMITKITRWVTFLSFPVFLVIICCSKLILSYLGTAFASGETALIIICIGQFISVAFGPVGNFAVTTKNEKVSIYFALIKLAMVIIFNAVFIPIWGLNGTAVATTLSLIFWNAGMFLTIKKRTGFRTWIFG
jgi:O-antigen/teichoic acid export membrane protein